MLHAPARSVASIFAAALLLTPFSFAFDTPLSDQSVREAYFLGQRHDGTSGRILENYTKHLPPPKSGPYISSVTFFTPFAQLVQLCDRYIGNYSAQQAQLDHRGQEELVDIVVEVQLTNSYGAFLANTADSRSGPPQGLVRRPYDFWKDFQVQAFSGNQPLTPSRLRGIPRSSCGRRGPCTLTGATLEFEFPGSAFTSDSATIQVVPPEGPEVSVSFDLSRFR
jgi:hypothetical protein